MYGICRVCNGKKFVTFLENIDKGEFGVYSLLKCQDCHFITIFPFPDKDSLTNYYKTTYWDKPKNESYDIRLKPLIRFLNSRFPGKSKLLDWGCGDGKWIRLADKYGFDSVGIDEFAEMVDHDRDIIKGDITSPELTNEKFDIITSFHVIEHLSDPVGEFNMAFAKLKPGGLMIVETPNIDSFSFKIFRKKWQPLHVPEHLNFFSPKTLETMISKAGGILEDISFFSFRASFSVIPLSLFPFLEPCKIRRLCKGNYPFILKTIYLLLQILFSPLTFCEMGFGRGAIMRFFISKKENS